MSETWNAEHRAGRDIVSLLSIARKPYAPSGFAKGASNMMTWQTPRRGTYADSSGALPRRLDAWHRDQSASALSIARWEDDGGQVGGTTPAGRLSTNGRMIPHGTRDI